MKKTRLKKLAKHIPQILIGLAMISFVSCKKDKSSPVTADSKQQNTVAYQTINSQLASYNGNWLVFANEQAFGTTIDSLNQNGDYTTFENSFQGYVSLRKKTEQLAASNNTDFYTGVGNGSILYTPDDAFATLVSEKGNIQIGDKIYCFKTGTNSYIVNAAYSSAVIQGQNPANIPGNQAITTTFAATFRNRSFDGLVTPANPGQPGNPLPGGNVTDPIYQNLCKFSDPVWLWEGDWEAYINKTDVGADFKKKDGLYPVRFKYILWRNYYWFYSSVGSSIEIENYRGGRWRKQAEADNLYIKGCARGSYHTPGNLCADFDWGPNSIFCADDKLRKLGKAYTTHWGVGCLWNIRVSNVNTHVKGAYKGDGFSMWFIHPE